MLKNIQLQNPRSILVLSTLSALTIACKWARQRIHKIVMPLSFLVGNWACAILLVQRFGQKVVMCFQFSISCSNCPASFSTGLLVVNYKLYSQKDHFIGIESIGKELKAELKTGCLWIQKRFTKRVEFGFSMVNLVVNINQLQHVVVNSHEEELPKHNEFSSVVQS